ncbi:hypothetical protein LQE92_10940 [Lacrimispora sp. NSJ-141]|uniref:Uncharacterized protein n=1 Tax=Lientehia hominis TaxID=2897778 RepID=A0AAP2RLF3_9FIRM|nr:hypothetical protein [Lientehia hominis]MCD2493133.1 hypothetical protein [Lientehia hominis]
MKRGIIATLMSLVILLGSSLMVFGAEEGSKTLNEYIETICLDEIIDTGERIQIIGRDYENGDAEFIQIVNNEIVSNYYVDRSESVINETSQVNGKQKISTIEYKEAAGVSYSPMAYTNAGTLTWNWSDGSNSGTCGAKLSFETVFNTKDKYDINGRYRNLAALASFISSVIALPASPATTVAKNVFSYLGVGFTVTQVLIPTYYVSANSVKVTHKAINTANSGHVNTLNGTQYTVTQTGYSNKTYTEGNYYSTSSFANRSTVYANAMYHLLFSYPSYSIKSWN